MYYNNISRISSVQFGILSQEQTREESITEVSKLISYEKNGAPSNNGLFDTKMGPSSKKEKCETDGKSADETPGYFGHIELNAPVFNHSSFTSIHQILSVTCYKCGSCLDRLIGDENAPSYEEIMKFGAENHPYPSKEDLLKLPPHKRLQRLKNLKTSMKKTCFKCDTDQPIKYIPNGKRGTDTIDYVLGNDTTPHPLYPEYVYRLFSKITDDDCKRLGFNPPHSHPSSLILNNIPVCPPLVRPSVQQGNGMMSQDHITIRYEEVLKTNSLIGGVVDGDQSKVDRYRVWLAADVASLFDNDPGGGFVSLPRNSIMPHQTFAQRIKGKEPKNGRIRGNLMSRRVEMSARSVITPDPMIDLDEIGIPKHVAMNITYPEVVSSKNIYYLEKSVDNGEGEYPGAVGIIRKNTTRVIKPQKNLLLEEGDTVIRHLKDGDLVLMNRQPTLHKKSMMGHRIRVLPGYSFRLNVNVTEPYNADFDGDEMNLHCPQSAASVNEALTLAGLKNQSMSPASNSPAIAFIQDNVLAAHVMSKDPKAFDRRDLMNSLARGCPHYYGKLTKSQYSGKDVFDMFTPDFTKPSNETLDKKKLVSLVTDTYHQEGIKKCFKMSGELQKLLIDFMTSHVYSVGPKDIVRSTEANKKVDDLVRMLMINVNKRVDNMHSGKASTKNQDFEDYVNKELDTATKGSEEILFKGETSRFRSLIESGSKGKKKNISQMKGFIGQQIVNGGRTNSGYTDRTLPHFKKYSENIKNRGFISNSFSTGLHPYEFFFHAGGGREGLIEQALQTGQTGYIQRQMIKTLEDLTISWNNTVSDAQGNIVQFLYGDDGSMGESIEKQSIEVCRKSYRELELTHSLTADEHWKKCVAPSVLETYVPIKKSLEHYFKYFLKIRDDVINIYTPNIPPLYCEHSVNIKKKLELLKNRFQLDQSLETDLDPLTIISSYTRMFDRCTPNKFTHGLLLFKFLVYAHAGPKSLICECRVTRKAFDYFINDLEESYKTSRVEPGEPVGLIAAQSIGEPCTQLTLNSFHFAGAGRAQGVPRLKEIMYLEASGRSGATTTIYLNKPHSFLKSDAHTILEEIEFKTVGDLLTQYEFFYQTPNSTVSDKNITNYIELENKTEAPYNNPSNWIIKLTFDDIEFPLMKKIWQSIYTNIDFARNIILDVNSIYFRIMIDAALKEIKVDSSNFDISQIDTVVDKGIKPVVVAGIDGLKNCKISEGKDAFEYSLDTVLGVVNKEPCYKIESMGSNLKELFKNSAVDTSLTESNNILDMYDMFGIEVARSVLIEQLFLVLKDVGTLDSRHISVLVDRMVGTGKLLGVNSRGMEGYDNGPLAKASFEKVLSVLRNAGNSGEVDKVTGISANVMLGQAPPLGTGTVSVSIDDDMMSQELASVKKLYNRNTEKAPNKKTIEGLLEEGCRFDID